MGNVVRCRHWRATTRVTVMLSVSTVFNGNKVLKLLIDIQSRIATTHSTNYTLKYTEERKVKLK